MPPNLPPTGTTPSFTTAATSGGDANANGSLEAPRAEGRTQEAVGPARQALRRRFLPAPHGGRDYRDVFLPGSVLPTSVRTTDALHNWLAEGVRIAFPPIGPAVSARTGPDAAQQAALAAPSYRDVALAPPRSGHAVSSANEARVTLSVPGLPPYDFRLPEPLSEQALAQLEDFLLDGGDPVQLHFDADLLVSMLLDTAGPGARPRVGAPAYEACAPTQLTRQQQAQDVCCVTKEPFAEIERPVAVRTGNAVHLFGYARLAEWWQDHQTNPATTLPLPAADWLRVLPEPNDPEG